MSKQGWVAIVDTEHGLGILGQKVCATETEALALLARYCRDWWDRDGPDDIDMPENDEELCTEYFKYAEGERGEIEPVSLPE